MALNALLIDPHRVWKGVWRWFDESMLDCCTPLEKVQMEGITLGKVGCLARCNGAEDMVITSLWNNSEKMSRLYALSHSPI